jgi:hypothetical protein
MTGVETSDEDFEVVKRTLANVIQPLLRQRAWNEAVSRLQCVVRDESQIGRRLLYMADLTHCLLLADRDDEALGVINEMIALDPDDPLNWSRLATWYFNQRGGYGADPNDLAPALQAAETAIAKARPSGYLLRYCLSQCCRIALAMKRYDLLEQSMQEILASPRRSEVPDIRLEGDFLARVPAEAIPAQLLVEYRSRLAGPKSGVSPTG